MKVHLRALGCRLNEAELETWSQTFHQQGFEFTQDPNDADLLVLNTCAVTNDASRKSRNLINRLHRDNPTAKLVVTGCHASLNTEQVADTLGVDLVVSNENKESLPEQVREKLSLPTMPLSATEPDDIALYTRGRHRAFIKIQDGCRYRCTFCIVTVARGDEKSRRISDIVEEIDRFHRSGINEAVLTGVHVGGFGSDTGENLYELIKAILERTALPRLRLASVEPWDLPENFFELFLNPRLMPHMHLPLQSGSDAVLRRMARRCKTSQFAELAARARTVIPQFNITTDVIAGFPGETDQDWQSGIEFIESVGFGHLHIFPFSPRQGTKASGLPDQIDKPLAQNRCKELAEIAERMKLGYLKAAISAHPVEVLWERPMRSVAAGKIRYTGYTPNYLRVETEVTKDIDLEYLILPTRITAVDEERGILIGQIEGQLPVKKRYPTFALKPAG